MAQLEESMHKTPRENSCSYGGLVLHHFHGWFVGAAGFCEALNKCMERRSSGVFCCATGRRLASDTSCTAQMVSVTSCTA